MTTVTHNFLQFGLAARRSWLLLIAALLALGACGKDPTPPEEALTAWVTAAEVAAQNKERTALLELISPDYADARGNDRGALERMLRVWFLRQQSIALLINIDNSEVFNDTAAQLKLTVGMAGTNNNVLGFSADAYQAEFDMVSHNDEWLLIAARWGEIGKELR